MEKLYRRARNAGLYFFFILGILNSPISYSKEVKMVTVNWPPYFAQKLKGEGFVTKVIRESLKIKGHSLKVKYIPWKRAVKEAKNGLRHHALLGCFSKERKRFLIIQMRLQVLLSIFFYEKVKKTSVQSPEELKGLTLGIVRGYAISEKLKKFMGQSAGNGGLKSVFESTNLPQLLKMIEEKNRRYFRKPSCGKGEYEKMYSKRKYTLIDGGQISLMHQESCLEGCIFVGVKRILSLSPC